MRVLHIIMYRITQYCPRLQRSLCVGPVREEGPGGGVIDCIAHRGMNNRACLHTLQRDTLCEMYVCNMGLALAQVLQYIRTSFAH